MWMSPEALWPERFNRKNAKPTEESDVHSLGMVIYEVRLILAVWLTHLRWKANRSFVDMHLTLT